MQLHTPLWDFALTVYAKPDIESICLTMQNDFGLSINQLLFAGWLASEKKSLDVVAIRQSQSQSWQTTVTAPIRELRLKVKDVVKPVAPSVYESLRRAELEAERVELAYLYQLALSWPRDNQALSCESLLKANLMQLLDPNNKEQQHALGVLCEAFLGTMRG